MGICEGYFRSHADCHEICINVHGLYPNLHQELAIHRLMMNGIKILKVIMGETGNVFVFSDRGVHIINLNGHFISN